MHILSTQPTTFKITAFCLAMSLALAPAAQTCYDIQGWDIPFDIAYDDDDNLMVTGRTDGGLLFLRIGLSGETLAQRAIPLVEHPDGYSMVEADEDSYLIGGSDYLYGEPGHNLPFLLKVDSAGNELWRRTFAPAGELEPLPIAQHIIRNMEAEAVYLATTDTVWMIGYDGTTLAVRAAEEMGIAPFYCVDMVQTENGIAILTFSNNILHFDENLQFLGSSMLDISFLSFRNIYSFHAASGGGFLIGGQGDNLEWKVVRADEQGATQWERSYTFPNYSWGYPRDIESFEDGFLIVGSLAKVDSYGFCPIMVKIGADGSPQWLKEIEECNTNNALDAFAIHPDLGLIYAAGRKYCPPGSTNLDAFVTLLDTIPTVILAEEAAEGAASFVVFPNPTTGLTRAVLPERPPNAPWQVSLFDAAGRLVLQRQERGPNFRLDAGSLPPALYLLRVTDGRQVFTQRLVVARKD